MWQQRKLSLKYFFITSVLLICSVLIYSVYYPYSNFSDQLATENISIEQALERIPTCTPDDRSRQRALLHTLQAWDDFSQKNHIQYWIAYGTLLGYVHHRALLPHVPSIDLFIMAYDTLILFQLSQSNRSSVYKLKVHPQWHLTEKNKRSYFFSEEIDFIAPNARFINQNEMVYLNIWPVYDNDSMEGKVVTSNESILTIYDTNYQWKSTRKEWTLPLRECKFSGIKVWCPAEAEKLMIDIYGEISLNMSSRKCVNSSWVILDEYESKTITTKVIETSIITKHSIISDIPNSKSNDDDLIEKALEDIPTCTSTDHQHQRIILTNLQRWARLAEEYNLEYWISFGSLVGYVQRRGLLPHDGDADVTMMNDDVPKLINISRSNFSSNYEIRIQPQWNIVQGSQRSYFPEQGIHFIGANARFINRETNKHIDIFPAHTFNPRYSINATENKESNNITEYGTWGKWISHPTNWTYPLKTCYFSGIKMLCPAQPEKLVMSIYGITALTKSDTKCVNGSWINAD